MFVFVIPYLNTHEYNTHNFQRSAYVRIYHLYETGGIYVDFSWLHLAPVPHHMDQGVYIRSNCASRHFNEKTKTGRCIKSSMYIFRNRHDPVLKCMLGML